MRGLRVLMLGQPRLEFDGQALTRLIAPKHQALVFYLATERGAVSRSRLASLLWSELDEQAARANLRVALTRLRRWLPGLLDTEGQQVGFVASAPLWVDLRELEQAASGSPAVALAAAYRRGTRLARPAARRLRAAWRRQLRAVGDDSPPAGGARGTRLAPRARPGLRGRAALSTKPSTMPGPGWTSTTPTRRPTCS